MYVRKANEPKTNRCKRFLKANERFWMCFFPTVILLFNILLSSSSSCIWILTFSEEKKTFFSHISVGIVLRHCVYACVFPFSCHRLFYQSVCGESKSKNLQTITAPTAAPPKVKETLRSNKLKGEKGEWEFVSTCKTCSMCCLYVNLWTKFE